MTTRIAVLAACIFCMAAPSAFAAHTLSLDAPSDVTVGDLTVVTANGTMPPEEVQFPYWYSLDAIPASFTTTCPDDHFVGGQFANSSGGAVLTFAQPEHPDLNGIWSVPVAVNATSPGGVLLCGYTDDGSGGTLAVGSALVTVHPRESAQPQPQSQSQPQPQSQPQMQPKTDPASQTRAGVRSCRALLSGRTLRNCIRRAVARGKARCRKLPRPRRAACIRRVQRAGRAR